MLNNIITGWIRLNLTVRMFLISSFILCIILLWKIVFIPFVIESTSSFILNWLNKKAYFMEIVLILVDINMECEDGGAEPRDLTWWAQVQTVRDQHSHLLGLAQGEEEPEEVGGELGVDNDRVETVRLELVDYTVQHLCSIAWKSITYKFPQIIVSNICCPRE